MSTNTIQRLIAISVAALGAVVFSGAGAAAADLPGALSQQGRLFDENNEPVNDNLKVTFTLYGAEESDEALWSEAHNISFQDGYFSVSLGDAKPFGPAIFDGSPRFLGIQIGDDDEMSPRSVVRSVPYAMLAKDVNGDIRPHSVSVPGFGMVISPEGRWLGPSAGIQGQPGQPGAQGPAGPQGAPGLVGPMGPMGPMGPQGIAGPQGPQGIAGPQGAAGPVGPMGPEGQRGPQGPQGVVSTSHIAGAGADPTPALDFVAPTVAVTVSWSQDVLVISNKALGSASPLGAGDLGLFICYRPYGGAITAVGAGSMGLQVPASSRVVFGLSAIVSSLPPGTYEVGLCGATSDPGWNNNDWGYTSAVIVNRN